MLIYDQRSTQYGFQYITIPFTSYFSHLLRDIACPFGRPGQNPGGEAVTQRNFIKKLKALEHIFFFKLYRQLLGDSPAFHVPKAVPFPLESTAAPGETWWNNFFFVTFFKVASRPFSRCWGYLTFKLQGVYTFFKVPGIPFSRKLQGIPFSRILRGTPFSRWPPFRLELLHVKLFQVWLCSLSKSPKGAARVQQLQKTPGPNPSLPHKYLVIKHGPSLVVACPIHFATPTSIPNGNLSPFSRSPGGAGPWSASGWLSFCSHYPPRRWSSHLPHPEPFSRPPDFLLGGHLLFQGCCANRW